MNETVRDSKHTLKRHPLANYLIKPRLQIRLTIFFILVVTVGTFCSLALFSLIKRLPYDGMETFRVAWFLLESFAPALWVMLTVSIIVGVLAGLYASRKVALPIYKVEQWAAELEKGNMKRPLGMRDNDYWEEMATYCNNFLKNIKSDFNQIEEISHKSSDTTKEALKKILDKYQY